MRVWWINQILNAMATAVTALFLVYLAVLWIWSFVRTDSDPHGYLRIFGVVAGLFLLILLFLLLAAAVALHRRRRVGFVYQMVAAAVAGLYGVLIPSTAKVIAVGLALAMFVTALAGLPASHRNRR